MQTNHVSEAITQLVNATATLATAIAEFHPKIQAELTTLRAVGRPEVVLSVEDMAQTMGDIKKIIFTQAGYITRIKLAIEQARTDRTVAKDLMNHAGTMTHALAQWHVVDAQYAALINDVQSFMAASTQYYAKR